MLVGEEFWNYIGGPDTYQDLLAVYQEVGLAMGKTIVDSLAFGF